MSQEKAMEQTEVHDCDQYLTFMLSGDEFAVPVMHMKEIIEYGDLTRVPMVPGFIRGVINLRGSVVPVIDLAAKFGMSIGEVTKRTCIVIVEIQLDGTDAVVGIVVDKVNQVLDIGEADIEPPPAFGARIRTDFIQGMGRLDGRFVVILNVDAVLSTEEIAIVGRLQEDAEAPATQEADGAS